MDKTISQLTEMNVSNIDNINGSIYVPVVWLGINHKLDLRSIIRAIISKIDEVTPYEELTPTSGLIDSSTIQAISSEINGIKNRLDYLEREGTWPEHTLLLTDGSTEMQYILKTCPNGGDTRTIINTDQVTRPNFYVTLETSNPTISGSTANVRALFTALNFHSNLSLEGGQVGVVRVSGSLTVTVQNSTQTLTLNELSVDLSSDSEFNLTKGTNKSHSTTINLSCTIPTGAIILGVTLTGSVNGERITGLATYSVSQGGFLGEGYITLAS